MICPQCKAPRFYWQDPPASGLAQCEKCRHAGPAPLPDYENYHQKNYLKGRHSRTLQTDPEMKLLLELLAAKPSERIADLGCGIGDFTAEIAKASADVTGYDLDVASAKARYPDLKFEAIDLGGPLPFEDATFDKIISAFTIEHLPDPGQFLSECSRCLRQGGTIVLSTDDKDFFLHEFYADPTHLREWNQAGFDRFAEIYFKKVLSRKACSMFKFYPLNLLFQWILHPDLVFVGMKK